MRTYERSTRVIGGQRGAALSLVATLGLVMAAGLVGCSEEPEPQKAAAGEACVVSADCQDGLACRSRLCVAASVSPDMDQPDGDHPDPDGGDPEDDSGTPTPEDYYISYLLETDNAKELRLLRTGTGEDHRVDPTDLTGVTCNQGCALTTDLAHFIYVRAGEAGGKDIWVAPLSAERKVTEAGERLVADVDNVRFHGYYIAFKRELPDSGGAGTRPHAFYLDVRSGQESRLGDLGSDPRQPDTWALLPEEDVSLVFQKTLNTMDVLLGTLRDDLSFEENQVYRFDGRNFQAIGGSFYAGDIAAAAMDDRRRVVAIALEGAPNNYQICSSDADCVESGGPGRQCGVDEFCTALEVTVHFIDLDNTQLLGTPCRKDSECGGVHECYIPSPTQIDKAICIPRRAQLGMPVTPKQDGKDGCEWMAADPDDAWHYTEVGSSPEFHNGKLYVLARRDCVTDERGMRRAGEPNMPHTDILEIDPTDGSYRVVYGNRNVDYRDSNCYDEANRRVDVSRPDCVAFLQAAMLSPDHNEFAFLGTNPQVSAPEHATSRLDVWSVLRNGEEQEWLGNHSEVGTSVSSLNVHPLP